MKDDRGNRQAYFGTGETFLFSLYPERAKYPWVGMEGDKNLGHGAELFMAADSKMITIGGGYVIMLCLFFLFNNINILKAMDKQYGWMKTSDMVKLITVKLSIIPLYVPVEILKYVS